MYFQTVGKNIIRTSTFIKVGVEDYIIGNVSKKVDEKRYTVEDMANTVEWALGLNYESNVQITATSSKVSDFNLQVRRRFLTFISSNTLVFHRLENYFHGTKPKLPSYFLF